MQQTVNIFKALSDETRLRILSLLLTEGELCVCDIIAALKLPQSTVSRHLAYLRKYRLVNDRRCGLWMYYSITYGNSMLQQDLVALLKKNLAVFTATLSDRKRLESFVEDNRCA